MKIDGYSLDVPKHSQGVEVVERYVVWREIFAKSIIRWVGLEKKSEVAQSVMCAGHFKSGEKRQEIWCGWEDMWNNSKILDGWQTKVLMKPPN